MRSASSAGKRDVAPESLVPDPAARVARVLEPVRTSRYLVRGPLPRTRPRRALLCASTPPQFVEMLRVSRFLKEGTEYDTVLWLQLLPHKLAEAMAVCEAEGFPYFAHQLGRVDPEPVAAPATAESPRDSTPSPPVEPPFRPAVPFVTDAVAALRDEPGDHARWVDVGDAVTHRLKVRARWVWLRVKEVALNPLRVEAQKAAAAVPSRMPRPGVRRRLYARLFPMTAWLGRRVLRMAEALGFRSLPRPFRRLTLPLFAVLLFLFDRGRFVLLLGLFRHYRRLGRSARDVVRDTRPDLVVVAEDALYDYASIVHQAWRKGVPTVVVPYTIATAAEPAEAILHDPAFVEAYSLDTWPGRLVARLLPHWVYTYNGRAMLRYPVALAIVYEALGLAPRRPWLFNDGRSVALAAESEHMAELYRREGLSASYVVLTGALYDDVAAAVDRRRAEAQAELLAELGLPGRRAIALCALPPRMELERRPGCEFTSYEQIVETMLRPLLELPDTSVVVSLHPTLRAPELRYVEEWGARVSARSIADLIARSDLYVAVISATIRSAISGGIPVINFDVFRYGYRDYDAAAGVVSVQEAAQYREVVRRFGQDPAYAEELRRAQRQAAPRWGFRDGRSGEALLGLFRHVTDKGTAEGFVATRGRQG